MRFLKYFILILAVAVVTSIFVHTLVRLTNPKVKVPSTWVCKSVVLNLSDEPALVESDIGDTPELTIIAQRLNNGIPIDLINRSHVEFNFEALSAGMAIKTICWAE